MDSELGFHVAQRCPLSQMRGGTEIVSHDPEELGANLGSPVVWPWTHDPRAFRSFRCLFSKMRPQRVPLNSLPNLTACHSQGFYTTEFIFWMNHSKGKPQMASRAVGKEAFPFSSLYLVPPPVFLDSPLGCSTLFFVLPFPFFFFFPFSNF